MIGASTTPIPTPETVVDGERVLTLGVSPKGCKSPAEGWAWCYRLAAHLVENSIIHPRNVRVESCHELGPFHVGLHASGGPRVRIEIRGDLLARELRAAINGAVVRVSEGRR